MSHVPKGVIEAFDYSGVRLGASRFRDQYEQTRDYFIGIPDDDILKGFRLRAGLPASGREMGGLYSGDDKGLWYSDGGGASTFGQWLSAFARMAKATGDAVVRDKARNLVHEWAKTIAADGLFGAQGHSGKVFLGHYTFDKMCCGLVDAAKYLGDSEALAQLGKLVEWGTQGLSRRRLPSSTRWVFGTDHSLPHESEWYTLGENLYRAFQLTGESRYKEFARVWHHTTFWEALESGEDSFPGKHAYSHVNALSSAAMAFAVTGEEQYLDTITNGYDILSRSHLYATGGYGPKELFFPADGSLARLLVDPYSWLGYPASFETGCGTWAGFKLARYLMMFTGAAHYGDWIERLVYNGIGAALPMAGYGKTFYYSDYRMMGGSKTHFPNLWPCCAGTFPQSVADYHNLIYFKDPAGIYVNLFVPSQVLWSRNGSTVELIQKTNFPEDGNVYLTVKVPFPSTFSLRFRVPGWVKGSVMVKINEQPLATSAVPGTWAQVKREWQGGDTLHISMPMVLDFVSIDPTYYPERAALMFGPVVLVADKGSHYGILEGDREDPESWIAPVDKPLTFTANSEPDRATFRPFYEVGERVGYWMYFDVVPRQRHSGG